jgi:N-acetylglucosaminyldiphosphoundecaprenol N-acetyl-beta-D-mannosaminyltransferase
MIKKSYSNRTNFEKKNIMGVAFSDLSIAQVLEYIEKIVKNTPGKHYLVTPNPEILVMASVDIRYKNALNGADLALADGVGVILASWLLGNRIRHRIAGVDLVENVVKHVAEKPITVGFLGGGPGIAVKTADCLKKKYPGLRVGLTFEGKPDNQTIQQIKDSKTDILFVAFGSPQQEIWISENIEKLPAKISIGVGGAFDFISGRVNRAPLWMRKIGLEWLFRLFVQPWRIRRQLSLLTFIYLVFKKRFVDK